MEDDILPLPGVLGSPLQSNGDSNASYEITFYKFLASMRDAVQAQIKQSSMASGANDPTIDDITDGSFRVWKNTTSGTVKLYVNDAGTLKSVALT